MTNTYIQDIIFNQNRVLYKRQTDEVGSGGQVCINNYER